MDAAYREAIAQATQDLKALINKEHCTPMLIRLAFNDALTYDAATNTSGANGTIRYYILASSAGRLVCDGLLAKVRCAHVMAVCCSSCTDGSMSWLTCDHVGQEQKGTC